MDSQLANDVVEILLSRPTAEWRKLWKQLPNTLGPTPTTPRPETRCLGQTEIYFEARVSVGVWH